MAYLLDTNIVIHARDGTDRVLDNFVEHENQIAISTLCFAELQRGIYKTGEESQLRRLRLEVLLPRIPVLPFDQSAAERYGRILAECGWSRARDFDRMIAAQALVLGYSLVTDNVADFSDISGLNLENWAA
ncbi:MAG: type II toxin-antitoxin system VapC family toxin [Rhizomicrobium sp.]